MSVLRTVILSGAIRKADRSAKITFVTELEESPEDLMQLDKLVGTRGVVYFKDSSQLTQAEMDAIDSTEVRAEGKTKSQRLRNVLYRVWEQLGEDYNAPFDTYYADEMERIIEHYKQKLD